MSSGVDLFIRDNSDYESSCDLSYEDLSLEDLSPDSLSSDYESYDSLSSEYESYDSLSSDYESYDSLSSDYESYDSLSSEDLSSDVKSSKQETPISSPGQKLPSDMVYDRFTGIENRRRDGQEHQINLLKPRWSRLVEPWTKIMLGRKNSDLTMIKRTTMPNYRIPMLSQRKKFVKRSLSSSNPYIRWHALRLISIDGFRNISTETAYYAAVCAVGDNHHRLKSAGLALLSKLVYKGSEAEGAETVAAQYYQHKNAFVRRCAISLITSLVNSSRGAGLAETVLEAAVLDLDSMVRKESVNLLAALYNKTDLSSVPERVYAPLAFDKSYIVFNRFIQVLLVLISTGRCYELAELAASRSIRKKKWRHRSFACRLYLSLVSRGLAIESAVASISALFPKRRKWIRDELSLIKELVSRGQCLDIAESVASKQSNSKKRNLIPLALDIFAILVELGLALEAANAAASELLFRDYFGIPDRVITIIGKLIDRGFQPESFILMARKAFNSSTYRVSISGAKLFILLMEHRDCQIEALAGLEARFSQERAPRWSEIKMLTEIVKLGGDCSLAEIVFENSKSTQYGVSPDISKLGYELALRGRLLENLEIYCRPMCENPNLRTESNLKLLIGFLRGGNGYDIGEELASRMISDSSVLPLYNAAKIISILIRRGMAEEVAKNSLEILLWNKSPSILTYGTSIFRSCSYAGIVIPFALDAATQMMEIGTHFFQIKGIEVCLHALRAGYGAKEAENISEMALGAVETLVRQKGTRLLCKLVSFGRGTDLAKDSVLVLLGSPKKRDRLGAAKLMMELAKKNISLRKITSGGVPLLIADKYRSVRLKGAKICRLMCMRI